MKERKFSYKLIKGLLKYIYIGIFRPKLYNKENIPKEGSVILAGNHVTRIDPCTCFLATSRVVHFLAKDKYYDIFGVTSIFKAMNAIRVDSNRKNPDALEEAYKVLNNGGVIGIFSEGTRNLELKDTLLPFRYGAVKMASVTNTPILPFAIKIGKKHKTMKQRVIFGKPYRIKSNDLVKENKILSMKIKKLLEEEI